MTGVLARPNRALETLRAQIAPGATDDELVYFGKVCERLGLDYFAGHVVLIGRYDRRADATVFRPQLTIEGRREIAERTGCYDGMSGPEWCGPRDQAGELRWRDVWDEDTNPYAARVFVYRKDRAHPANGTVKWAEFAQYLDKDRQKLAPLWAQMPSHMLAKTAESLALRRGFTQVSAALAVVGGDEYEPAHVDDDTGEINPVAHALDRLELQHRLEQLRQDNYGWYQTIVGTWKARNRPPLGHDDFTAAHAAELAELIDHPNIVGPQTDEPTPADVIDGQPEAVDEAAYRYDPEDGRPFQ